ncbi:hypothetical protein [Mangrovimonas cancribranchiae]|uniref:DinB-like domain-containing protein n=1 Tax=Mangrovimonas cancribranchiae TaxID=3080055 RepID=A0AAU6P9J7_9FLAO
MRHILLFLAFILVSTMQAQNNTLPYYEVPEAPKTYTAGTVVARQIDGLGFRFYWATDSLNDNDLLYKPNEEAKTVAETIEHIFSLSQVILSAALQKPVNKTDASNMSAQDIRKEVLFNLKQAADILSKADDLTQFNIDFGAGKTYPFWNAINGPIADAIWHSGQIASFRRTSGNPINSKINHFTGTIRD